MTLMVDLTNGSHFHSMFHETGECCKGVSIWKKRRKPEPVIESTGQCKLLWDLLLFGRGSDSYGSLTCTL